MNKMLSFILPIYNTPSDYLRKSLDSLRSFHMEEVEFLLIDDGSTKNHIQQICKEYQKNDPRFHYIYKENGRVSSARNKGLQQASGKWIFFLDPDDCLTKDSESYFRKYLHSTDEIILFGEGRLQNEEIVFYNKTSRIPSEKKKLTSLFVVNEILTETLHFSKKYYWFATPWGMLISRQFLVKNHLFFDEKIIKREDAEFTLRLFQQATAIRVADPEEVVYLYRIDNPHSSSVTYNPSIMENYLYLLGKIQEEFSQVPIKKDALSLYTYELSKELVNLDFCNQSNEATYKQRKEKFLTFRENETIKHRFISLTHYAMPRWKKGLYWAIRKKQFWLLNLLYVARKLRKKD